MEDLEHNAAAGATPSLGRSTGKHFSGMLVPEPTFQYRLRPRCARCGAPSAYIAPSHALADRFPQVVSAARAGRSFEGPCLVCDTPFPPDSAVVEVPAVLTGRSPRMLLARLLLAIGRFFAALARRF